MDKDKNINCMQKTRMDWDKHVDKEGDADDLAKNRKDGYLQKRNFLDKVGESEYAAKREAEKVYQKNLLK